MIRKSILLFFITMLFVSGYTAPVKADMVTASQQIPVLKDMYHVNDVANELKRQNDRLNALLSSGAAACDIADGQAKVNEAALLLNTLNAMVINESMITAALPTPGACSQSVMSNALLAQAAWTDYVNRAKAAQATLNYSYADKLIASNQNALITQAAFAHLHSPANLNPVTQQAIANWTTMNGLASDRNLYALVNTLR